MNPNLALRPLNPLDFGRVRSFLIGLSGLVVLFAPGLAEVLNVDELATGIVRGVDLYNEVVSAVLFAWAYGHRMAPHARLDFRAPFQGAGAAVAVGKVIAAVLALLAAIGATATPAAAETLSCDEHGALLARLAEGWGENRRMVALRSDGAVMEFFASEDTGTWTVAVTQPGQLTCIIAEGEAFEAVDEPLIVGTPS